MFYFSWTSPCEPVSSCRRCLPLIRGCNSGWWYAAAPSSPGRRLLQCGMKVLPLAVSMCRCLAASNVEPTRDRIAPVALTPQPPSCLRYSDALQKIRLKCGEFPLKPFLLKFYKVKKRFAECICSWRVCYRSVLRQVIDLKEACGGWCFSYFKIRCFISE